MQVRVAVRLRGRIARLMSMLMVNVMHVPVLMLERLMQVATLRDGAAAGDQELASRPGAISPIGLDDRGLPFTLSGDLAR